MKKTILIMAVLLLSFQTTYAYSFKDVSTHNLESDCWIVFEENVYDITEYVPLNDLDIDIRTMCGKDVTRDIASTAVEGEDYKTNTYNLLQQYLIGDITLNNGNTLNTSKENPYNLVIPLLLSIILYWIPYMIIKTTKKLSLLKGFNGFWNTMLFLFLLIPTFGFGILMILKYHVPALSNIRFNFLYWHVELSIFMGVLGINHFLQRFPMYLTQLKRRRNS